MRRALCILLLGIVALWAMLRSARGQPYVSQDGDSILGKYNATTDVAINADFLIMGLDGPTALVLSGNNLFVANYGSGTVGEYNATTGAAINSLTPTSSRS
jgi:hypothetical protein